MTAPRPSRRGPVLPRPLSYAPPPLTNPRAVTVSEDPATRFIVLNAGEDLRLTLPPTPVSTWGDYGQRDSLIHVQGGRNVVVIGGHIRALPTPVTTVTTPIDASVTTIAVADTSAFPGSGSLRIDGEGIYYTGKTSTSFTGCTRDAFYYNASPTSSLTHAAGAAVRLAEQARHGLFFENTAGTVHVEGLLMDGELNDGLRLWVEPTAIVQVQNCRIGPVVTGDQFGFSDGHPDCLQIFRGPAEVRMDRVTMLNRNGRCILNTGSDGNQPTGKIILRDVEGIGLPGHPGLFDSPDASTVWEAWNAWALPQGGLPYSDPRFVPLIAVDYGYRGDGEFVRAENVGIGYRAPGYLA